MREYQFKNRVHAIRIDEDISLADLRELNALKVVGADGMVIYVLLDAPLGRARPSVATGDWVVYPNWPDTHNHAVMNDEEFRERYEPVPS